MPRINLRCLNCGKVFFSGFNVGPETVMVGNQSQCPHCQSLQAIPDGVYGALEGAFRMLSDKDWQGSMTQEVAQACTQVAATQGTLEDVLSKVKDETARRNLGECFKKFAPQNAVELAAYIALLGTFLLAAWGEISKAREEDKPPPPTIQIIQNFTADPAQQDQGL